jgi:pimeloyl-ACP methyl ester carboxylesterase
VSGRAVRDGMAVARVDGVELVHERRGEGPVVLLIAGTGGSAAEWVPEAVDVFAERFTVIRYDQRGTGQSPGTPGPYSTRGLARDALGLLDALAVDRAHVIGHSMGGRVAQWLALDAPGRVASLTLASSGPGEYPGQFDDGRAMMRGIPLRAATCMIEEGYEAWLELYIRESMLTAEFQAEQPERTAALIRETLELRPPVEDYLKHTIARQLHQTDELLDGIAAPVLVVVGERDRDVGGTGNHFEQSEYLARRLGASFQVLPGVAHGYHWERPAETMAVIRDWLLERGD